MLVVVFDWCTQDYVIFYFFFRFRKLNFYSIFHILCFKIKNVELWKEEKMVGTWGCYVRLRVRGWKKKINEKRVTRETLVLSSFGDPQKSDTLDLALILETGRSRRDSSSQLFAFITLFHRPTILILSLLF